MKTFTKRFSDYIVAGLFTAMGFFLRFFSEKIVRKVGRFLGFVLRIIGKSRYAVTVDNISRAFPEHKQGFHEAVARGAYQTLGITLAETLVLPYQTPEQLRQIVRCPNPEVLEEALQEGKGVVLLSGHLGNWEIMALSPSLYLDISVTVIVKRQSNAIIDARINRYRQKTGNTIVYMKQGARAAVHALRSGGAIALLADQSAGVGKHINVPFFGREAATFTSPAALAVKYGSPIITGYAIRNDIDGGYDVTLKRLVKPDLTGMTEEEAIEQLTLLHVQELEAVVRRYPHLWAWQHRRWK